MGDVADFRQKAHAQLAGRPAALPCIACGRALERVHSGAPNQPYDGLCFATSGHYGSTVFDDIVDSGILEISVCDPCVVRAAHAGKLHRVLPSGDVAPYEPEGL